ncbi:hypothetical protein BDV18DRAFT_67864 [Aspergillus unguis]
MLPDTQHTTTPNAVSSPDHAQTTAGRPQRTPRRSCTLLMKDTTVLWKLFNLILSTILLLINIAIYTAFVVIRAIRGPWLYIVLTFILLTIGVIWCHSLCRFIVTVYQFPNNVANRTLPNMAETAGYAQPNQPIRVTMAIDEERLTESDGNPAVKVTAPPPAYGLWRSSVRLNPDLLHWQRVENQPTAFPTATPPITEREESPRRNVQGRRPPSYMSDDGVQYVVEAQPRSFPWFSPQ